MVDDAVPRAALVEQGLDEETISLIRREERRSSERAAVQRPLFSPGVVRGMIAIARERSGRDAAAADAALASCLPFGELRAVTLNCNGFSL